MNKPFATGIVKLKCIHDPREMLIAIDPGPQESAFIVMKRKEKEIFSFGKVHNVDMLQLLRIHNKHDLIIEMIKSYGMPVGDEVFMTCLWIGRFIQAHAIEDNGHEILVGRKTVSLFICNSPRAKDANVRTALIDIYGKPGTSKHPGPTFGITGDVWSALAVAHYAIETNSFLGNLDDAENSLSSSR